MPHTHTPICKTAYDAEHSYIRFQLILF